MHMPVNSKEIIKDAKSDEKKIRVTFTLAPNLLERFRVICEGEGTSYSSIVESLIKDFVQDYEKKKK